MYTIFTRAHNDIVHCIIVPSHVFEIFYEGHVLAHFKDSQKTCLVYQHSNRTVTRSDALYVFNKILRHYASRAQLYVDHRIDTFFPVYAEFLHRGVFGRTISFVQKDRFGAVLNNVNFHNRFFAFRLVELPPNAGAKSLRKKLLSHIPPSDKEAFEHEHWSRIGRLVRSRKEKYAKKGIELRFWIVAHAHPVLRR
ncbi:MAG: hypothetical protein ACOCQQ_02545 [Candidatus Nanoarchaeia archaeon]